MPQHIRTNNSPQVFRQCSRSPGWKSPFQRSDLFNHYTTFYHLSNIYRNVSAQFAASADRPGRDELLLSEDRRL